jgi:hypothetical protein
MLMRHLPTGVSLAILSPLLVDACETMRASEGAAPPHDQTEVLELAQASDHRTSISSAEPLPSGRHLRHGRRTGRISGGRVASRRTTDARELF